MCLNLRAVIKHMQSSQRLHWMAVGEGLMQLKVIVRLDYIFQTLYHMLPSCLAMCTMMQQKKKVFGLTTWGWNQVLLHCNHQLSCSEAIWCFFEFILEASVGLNSLYTSIQKHSTMKLHYTATRSVLLDRAISPRSFLQSLSNYWYDWGLVLALGRIPTEEKWVYMKSNFCCELPLYK